MRAEAQIAKTNKSIAPDTKASPDQMKKRDTNIGLREYLKIPVVTRFFGSSEGRMVSSYIKNSMSAILRIHPPTASSIIPKICRGNELIDGNMYHLFTRAIRKGRIARPKKP